ncbi:response regulator [Leptolyngbya sp. NIES-2104]|uniref:response regulator n=1 Tax=Leptolyngbya sp. NIES-2104 TaxID=1552121 RepID=UPI0006EC72D5|nr:response regulator [Leptolyngbya sp. NIES-2104]GAP94577.1 two-component response regulator [Leptolyngbya sp. NIES-2104]
MAVIVPSQSVLLIDDDASIREIVQACLSDLAGWKVKTVASAQEALNWLGSEHPDVILLDILMPGMDAVTFLQRLRASCLTQTIPVILLTVQARWYSPQQLQKLSVIDAIAKPFDPVALPDQIAQALTRSQ